MQIIDAASDHEFAILFQLAKDGALRTNLGNDEFDVFRGHFVFKLGATRRFVGCLRNLLNSRLDFFQQSGDVTELGMVASAADRAAAGMADDDNCLCSGFCGGKFETTQQVIIEDIARDASTEDVANALVKDEFVGSA